MGCKTSKILHDPPCTCQHAEVVRTPSHSSSFYNSNSNSSTYSSGSDYSEESSSRPFFRSKLSDHASRPRIRKEGSSRSHKNKPLPRRNRSGREIKVLVPKTSQRRRKSPEPNRQPEELAPWAVAQHNKLVPIIEPVKNANVGRGDINFNHNHNPGNDLFHRRDGRARRGAPTSDYVVTGGYVVSPEVYYASLPLPDLPPARHSEPLPKRDDVIVEQLRQNAEIVQARRMKDNGKGKGKYGIAEPKKAPKRI